MTGRLLDEGVAPSCVSELAMEGSVWIIDLSFRLSGMFGGRGNKEERFERTLWKMLKVFRRIQRRFKDTLHARQPEHLRISSLNVWLRSLLRMHETY